MLGMIIMPYIPEESTQIRIQKVAEPSGIYVYAGNDHNALYS
jgi:hypothetical protein